MGERKRAAITVFSLIVRVIQQPNRDTPPKPFSLHPIAQEQRGQNICSVKTQGNQKETHWNLDFLSYKIVYSLGLTVGLHFSEWPMGLYHEFLYPASGNRHPNTSGNETQHKEAQKEGKNSYQSFSILSKTNFASSAPKLRTSLFPIYLLQGTQTFPVDSAK